MRHYLLALCLLFTGPVLLNASPAPEIQAHELRIATPWPAQNAIIMMLGYGDNIVGTSMVAKQIPLFRQMLPHIDDVPVIGTTGGNEVNAEQILSLQTDILFIHDGIRIAQQDALVQAGVRILTFKANGIQALRDRVKRTGDALGAQAGEKALRYDNYFQDNIRRVQQRLLNVPEPARLRVYHSMGNPLYTSGRPSLNQDWMDLAGAINVAENWFSSHSNTNGEVALEQIIAADPQVIIAMNDRDAQHIRHSPQWQTVDAVKNERVYTNPRGMFWWCRETSEEALQFLWLATVLYPEQFSDINMTNETADFYREFYGITLTPQQIAGILQPE
ncbi:MAG: ABC transporter substrate-binding protein [Morganella sp. (in: enterobacteria)]